MPWQIGTECFFGLLCKLRHARFFNLSLLALLEKFFSLNNYNYLLFIFQGLQSYIKSTGFILVLSPGYLVLSIDKIIHPSV